MPKFSLPRVSGRSARLNSTLAVALGMLTAIVSPGIRATAQTATVSGSGLSITGNPSNVDPWVSSTGTSNAPAGSTVASITSVVLTGVTTPSSNCVGCDGISSTAFILRNNSSGQTMVLLGATGTYNDSLTQHLNNTTINIVDGQAAAPNGVDWPASSNVSLTVKPSSYYADNFAGDHPNFASQIGVAKVLLPQDDGSPAATLGSTFNTFAADGTWTLYMAEAEDDDTTISFTGWTVNMTYAAGTSDGTTTSLTSLANPAAYSTDAATNFLTATVTDTSNPTIPTGTVTFSDTTNGAALCTNVPLAQKTGTTNKATASCSVATSSLGQGLSTILAQYNPNTGFESTQGSISQLIEVPPSNSTNTIYSRWCNTASFKDPGGGTKGQAYPSVISVSGLAGDKVINVGVELLGVTGYLQGQHLLVGPGGTKNLDFEDDGFNSNIVNSGTSLYFADAGSYFTNFAGGGGSASASTAGQTPNSTTDWRATDLNTSGLPFPSSTVQSIDSSIPQVPGTINFAPPVGTTPSGTPPPVFQNNFQNIDPDGNWALYVIDLPSETETFGGGWCLDFTLAIPPAITSTNHTTFTAGVAGTTFQVTASGSPAPTFSLTSGSWPSGLGISSAGLISGTPGATTGGLYTLDITATNSVGTSTQPFTLTVNQAPSITSANSTTFTTGAAGSFQMTASAYPTATFSYTGTLPGGVTLSTAGLLSGTPNAGTGGNYPIIVTANNGVSPNGTQSFTLTVDQPPAVTSPAPSTLLGGPTVFSWNPGFGSTQFQVYVGTAGAGSHDLYQGPDLAASVTSSASINIPFNGATLYVRLWYLMNGTWQHVDYTYTEAMAPSMSSPVVGTFLGGTTTFTWNPGTGSTAFQVYVGTTGAGSSDLYKGPTLAGTATSSAAITIPTNGATLYVRLWYQFNGVWRSQDYTYTEGTPPSMTSPSPGAMLGGYTVFSWSPGAGSSKFQVYIGTTGAGSHDFYQGPNLDGTITSSATINIPDNGVTLYVRLWYFMNGNWLFQDYTYTEKSVPTIISPSAGALLGGPTTFVWNPGVGISAYQIYAGTTGVGSSNLYRGPDLAGTATSSSAINFPLNGDTLYIRLWYEKGTTWQSVDYTWTEATAPSISTPTPGSTIGSPTTFTWNPGAGSTTFQVYVGTTGAGSSDVYRGPDLPATATSSAAVAIPTNGAALYVRLWYVINGAWQFHDYTYTEQ